MLKIFFLILLLSQTLYSIELDNSGKFLSFTCHHGGSGNDSISGEIFTINKVQYLKSEKLTYDEGGGTVPIYLKSLTFKNSGLYFEGVFMTGTAPQMISLSIKDIFNPNYNDKMMIGDRSLQVSVCEIK